ncbi:type II toxin-antitoxin system Phd/YefM family antitoxin [Leucobacter denitrificans]|uniref:Antitoxin n=2 Tax=Leucobacter denitrificans TaxID=683042 RepID=A0A7G9S7Y3_9MICO|nr:type II toxin-antitoxin system Phd/YefM family antitoxin [Leucobacter denitrificans]
MGTWQVQAGKQRFSELLRAAEGGEPQFITRHGKPVAVVVDIEDYRRTHETQQSFAEYLLTLEGALAEGDELEISPRTAEPEYWAKVDNLFRDGD